MNDDAKNECPDNCIGMTEEELEQRLALAHVSSSSATLENVRDRLLSMAGNFYANGKDTEAQLLRSLGNKYKEMAALERQEHEILLKEWTEQS